MLSEEGDETICHTPNVPQGRVARKAGDLGLDAHENVTDVE